MAEKQSEQTVKPKHDGEGQAMREQQAQQAQQAAQAEAASQQAAPEPSSQIAAQAPQKRESPRIMQTSRGQQGPSLARTSYVSPLSLLGRMTEEMDRVFETFGFPRASAILAPVEVAGEPLDWNPQLELFDRGDQMIVRVDLPGTSVDDIRVNVDDDTLTVEGERRYEHEEQGDDVYRSERVYGRFSRTIPLPDGIDTNSVNAKFENGVLEIAMNKEPEQESRARQVPIAGATSAKLGAEAFAKESKK